jgi:hypothetical protein
MSDNAAPEADFEITEDIFDKVGAPLIVAFALTSLETQIDALTDVNDQLREAFATWVPEMRDRAVSDLRRSIDQVREVLDRLESALPEVSS